MFAKITNRLVQSAIFTLVKKKVIMLPRSERAYNNKHAHASPLQNLEPQLVLAAWPTLPQGGNLVVAARHNELFELEDASSFTPNVQFAAARLQPL